MLGFKQDAHTRRSGSVGQPCHEAHGQFVPLGNMRLKRKCNSPSLYRSVNFTEHCTINIEREKGSQRRAHATPPSCTHQIPLAWTDVILSGSFLIKQLTSGYRFANFVFIYNRKEALAHWPADCLDARNADVKECLTYAGRQMIK